MVFHVVECAPKVDVADVYIAGVDGSVVHRRKEGGVAMEDSPHAAKSVLCVPHVTVLFSPLTANSFEDRCPEFEESVHEGYRAIGITKLREFFAFPKEKSGAPTPCQGHEACGQHEGKNVPYGIHGRNFVGNTVMSWGFGDREVV